MTQVSIMAVRALVSGVERAGVRREDFLAQAGFSAAEVEDPTLRVPVAAYMRALRAALTSSRDPALGLHMGEQASLGMYDVLGYVTEHTSSLREALQLAVRYGRIVMEGPTLELLEHGDTATLRFTQLDRDEPEVHFTAEFAAAALLGLVRRFAGEGATPRRALFAYRAPEHRAEYDRAFGEGVQFRHAFTGLELERALLDRGPAHRSPELYAILQARAELLLAQVEHDAPIAERVKQWLASQHEELRPTMDTVARALGMSSRSLRRRLQEEGASFSELTELARALRAKHMLADRRRSVQETAYSLGFATPAAFSRAFKRWTGIAPSAYRAAR